MTGPAWPLNVPVLSDGVVTLRAHTATDIDRMWEMAEDPDMVRWTAIPTPHSRSMSEQFALEIIPGGWNEGTVMCWAIEFEGRYAGNVDIRGKGPLADLGYALHPDCRGRSLMTAAVRLAVDHSFVDAGKEAVGWRSQVGNLASLRVAHACGFRLHGVQPDGLQERGRILDAWTGSIRFGDPPVARTEWRAPTLITERLQLRPLRTDDVPRLVEACTDPITRCFLTELPDPYGPREALAHVHDSWWSAAVDHRVTWALAGADGSLLGTIAVMGLAEPGGGQAELGYWLHPDARGRGLMTEAARAVVAHAFDATGLDRRRLSLTVAEGNDPSRAIARSLGFTHYGTEHGTAVLADGTTTDHHLFELLR